MKTKFNLRHLLLVVLLIVMCLFSTNMVQAADVKQDETKSATTTEKTQETETTTQSIETKTTTTEQTQIVTDPKEILALIPNTIKLDILESDIFGNEDDYILKSETLVDEQINTILTNNNIDLDKMGIIFSNDLGIDKDTIRKSTIRLEDKKTYKTLAEKEITIKYKNSDNYNNADEQYVKNKLKNIDFNLFVAKEIGQRGSEDYREIVEQNTKKVINDNSLTVFVKDIAGGGSDVTVIGFKVYVYKNDILYSIKSFEYVEGTMIVIPDNIQDTDEAYINYALPKIKEYWSDFTVKGVTKMTGAIKQNDDIVSMNIKNDGTFYMISLDDDDWARVVLKKASTTKVIDHVAIKNSSGVSINGTNIDKNNSVYTEMLNKAKAKGYGNVFGAYELKLVSGSIKDGLTITFSLGTENDGKQVIVIHKTSSGDFEEFTKTVKDGKIDITVKELSPFMIALKDNKTATTTKTPSTPNKVLDDEPKTGTYDYTIFASVVSLISLGGIAVLKFKK